MLRKLFLGLVSAGLFAGAAHAATLDGVTLPDTYPVDGQTLVLNGIAVRTLTIFNVKVYVAGLYLPKKNANAQQILASSDTKVVLLQFLHSGSKSEVDQEYRNGEKTNCQDGSCNPADEADFEKLIAAAPAVKVGDTSTYIINAKGLRVYANNKMIGNYANPGLAYQILAGFIGAHPPSADVRRELLGGAP